MRIIQINNKTRSPIAKEVLHSQGFKSIPNRSVNVGRDFFSKDGKEYSLAFPVWNGFKVRIRPDYSGS